LLLDDGGAQNAGMETAGVDKVWKAVRTKYSVSELRRLPCHCTENVLKTQLLSSEVTPLNIQ